MGIFLLWKLLEPKREGEVRSAVELVAKPAAVMAGGVVFLGICMINPRVLFWTLVLGAILAIVTYIRMPASERASVARAVDTPDPAAKWSMVRLILATILVFALVAAILVAFGSFVSSPA